MNVCPVSEILVLDTEHERRTIRVVIKLSENECNNPLTSDISTSCVFANYIPKKNFKARQVRFSMIHTKIPQQNWDFTLLIATQNFLFCFAFLAGAIAETSHPIHIAAPHVHCTIKTKA